MSTDTAPMMMMPSSRLPVPDPTEGFPTTAVLDTENHADIDDSQSPMLDIIINNVVCTFSTKCHLNLKRISTEGMNVIYKRENGMVSMKLRHPHVTASIWSSGKVTCTGSTSEEEAKVAGRKVARCLQRLGFKVRFTQFRIVNVLGTCSFPFAIKITDFSRNHKEASYEPELHPGVTYKLHSPKATLKIFSTGSITVTAPSISNVQRAIEHIFPLVEEYKTAVANIQPQEINIALARHPDNRHRKQWTKMYTADSDEELSDG